MSVSRLAPQPVAFYAAVFCLVNATYICLIYELIDRVPAADVSPSERRIMRFRSITTLCVFAAAAVVALKYPLFGLGMCICCLIVFLEHRRAQTAKATAAYPPLAIRGGIGGRVFSERYRALPEAERARIIQRCVLGWYRWFARVNGLPPPIEMTSDPVALPDGGIAAKPGSLREMTQEELAEIFPPKSDT
jgi:hypothetical protein